MVTLFTTPKNFTDIFKTIQLNALRSWRALSPEIQIIIFGDSEGSKEASEEVGAEYFPNVKCSPEGTPLLSDLFQQAVKRAKYPIMVFINADIILPKNFLEEVMTVSKCFNKFLMIGHRWDMDVENIIEFNNDTEQKKFWDRVRIKSEKHACTGIDYFVYKKHQWGKIPDFIIGRPGFDNWIIWKARRRFYPIIDATEKLMVVHQNHQVHHLYELEGDFNRKLHKGRTLNLLDCTYKLSDDKIIRKNDSNFKERYFHRLPLIFSEFSIILKIFRRLYNRYKNY